MRKGASAIFGKIGFAGKSSRKPLTGKSAFCYPLGKRHVRSSIGGFVFEGETIPSHFRTFFFRLPLMTSDFMRSERRRSAAGLTLLEILVVVAIIAILAAVMVPGFGVIRTMAEAAKNSASVKEIVAATLTWSMDHGDKLPSPEYPGGMVVPNGKTPDDIFPEYWDLMEGGTEWLDGVVFATMYLEEAQYRAEAGGGDSVEEGDIGGYQIDEQGTHLKGTHFESTQSVRKNPVEEDWHHHSYAMNKNLQYDRIHETSGSSDPWLTEKSRSNLIHAPSAMLYIDCEEPNIVSFDDRPAIIETIEERWGGGKAIVGFLDGHVERLAESEIPDEDPETDIVSSRFWRGVDPDNR